MATIDKAEKVRIPDDIRVTLAMGLMTRADFVKVQREEAAKGLRHEDVVYWDGAGVELAEARRWLDEQL